MFKVFIIAHTGTRYDLDEFHPAPDLVCARTQADDLEAAYLKWEEDGFPPSDGLREDVRHYESCEVYCEDLTTRERFILEDRDWKHC